MPVTAVDNPEEVSDVDNPRVPDVDGSQVEGVDGPHVGTPVSPQVGVVPVSNLANTPVNWVSGMPRVTGALSAALATPEGDNIDVRGLFSMMALSSGY